MEGFLVTVALKNKILNVVSTVLYDLAHVYCPGLSTLTIPAFFHFLKAPTYSLLRALGLYTCCSHYLKSGSPIIIYHL